MPPTQGPQQAVLLVDDDEFFRMALREVLVARSRGLTVFEAGNGAEALRILGRETIHCVMNDLAMPGMDGVALLEQMLSQRMQQSVLVVSAFAKDFLELDGLPSFFSKPVDLYRLCDRVIALADPRCQPRPMTLMGFMYVLACERRTCVIKVRGEVRCSPRTPWCAELHMNHGVLSSARLLDLGGEARVGADAAIEMLVRSTGEVRVEHDEQLGVPDAGSLVDAPLRTVFASAHVRRKVRAATHAFGG